MESSAGVILFRERKGSREYLLLKYKQPENYWGLVKGRIEAGEKEEETALREVKEETGLENVELLPGFREKTSYFFTREGKKIYKEVIWFVAEVSDKKEPKVSGEHETMAWFPYGEAIKMITYPKDRNVLEKAERLVAGQ